MFQWWLSFADPDKPEGEQFLGCAVITAPDMGIAVMMAHVLYVNPGGQVAGYPLRLGSIPVEWCDRLLTRDEVDQVPKPAGAF